MYKEHHGCTEVFVRLNCAHISQLCLRCLCRWAERREQRRPRPAVLPAVPEPLPTSSCRPLHVSSWVPSSRATLLSNQALKSSF